MVLTLHACTHRHALFHEAAGMVCSCMHETHVMLEKGGMCAQSPYSFDLLFWSVLHIDAQMVDLKETGSQWSLPHPTHGSLPLATYLLSLHVLQIILLTLFSCEARIHVFPWEWHALSHSCSSALAHPKPFKSTSLSPTFSINSYATHISACCIFSWQMGLIRSTKSSVYFANSSIRFCPHCAFCQSNE